MKNDGKNENSDNSQTNDSAGKCKKARTTHSEVEKRRREKMNKYLFELTPYLPARQTNVNKKLDKISILKLTNEHVKYLKNKSNNTVSNARPVPDESILCEYATDRELEALMFDSNSMDGFLIIVKCDTNRIVQVSESCAKYIGFSPKNLLGQPFLDLVHLHDQQFVKDQLSNNNNTTLVSYSNKMTNKRSFLCRIFNGAMPSTNKQPPSQVIHFNGCFKYDSNDQDRAKSNVATTNGCHANRLPAVISSHIILHGRLPDTTAAYDEYVSKYDIDGKYIYVEPQVYGVLGFMDRELLHISLEEFVKTDDFYQIQKGITEAITTKKKVKTKPYRHITKQPGTIYIESVFYALFNPFNSTFEYIIANNKRFDPTVSTTNL